MTVAENMSLAQGFSPATWSGALGLIDWRGERSARPPRRSPPSAATSTRRPASTPSAAPRSRSSPSPARWSSTAISSCSTSRRPACPADEVERLFEAIRRLKARGVGMIYVSHRLDEIFRIADRVVVMRDGLKVGEQAIGETSADELVSLIVGRSTLELFKKADARLRQGPRRGRAASHADGRAGRLRGPRRASFWASSACAAPARRRSAGRCSAPSPHRGAIRSTAWRRTSPRRARRCSPASASSRATAREESVAPSLTRARERLPQSRRLRPRPVLAAVAGGRGAARPSRSAPRSACGRTIPICRSRACRAATSRRSSSAAGSPPGRKLLVAEDPTAGVDVGAKAEIYRLDRAGARARPRGRRGLDRFRGDRPYLPPRPRLQSRPDHRRAHRRRPDHRDGDHRGLGLGSGLRSETGGQAPWR